MGEWRESILVNILDTIESGQRPVGGATTVSGEIPSLGGENISSNGRLVLDNIKKIPIDYFKKMNKGKLVGYEVLINKDGANTGKVGYYNKDYENASINEHLFLLRGKADRVKQKYLYYSLLNDHGQIQIKNRITGSAQPGLSKEFVNYVKIYIPDNLYEQEKIAEILTTIDNTIEQTEKIIAKYRRIKQGLLQDLLTKGIDENGNIRSEATHKFKDSPLGRIPVEWEFGTIGEVAKVRRGASPRPIDNPEYFSDIGKGWVRITDVTNAYKFLLKTSQYMSLLGESLSVKVNKGELILSICATVGKPIILGIDACIHDGFVHIYDYQKRIDRDYLFYFLDYNQEKIKLKSQIGTQGNLNTDIVKNIELIIPPYKEQLTISETLTNIDNNLDIEQKNLKKLHSIKQGLMQDLLTGKVRVTHLLNKGGKSNECHP